MFFFFFEVLCYVWHDVNMRINIDIMHDEWTLKNRNENICKNKITEACKVLVMQVKLIVCTSKDQQQLKVFFVK